MMEMMMWQPEVIRALAQSAIPASVCDAIARQGSILSSTETMRSLALSAMDLELHCSATVTDMRDFESIAQSVVTQYVQTSFPQ